MTPEQKMSVSLANLNLQRDREAPAQQEFPGLVYGNEQFGPNLVRWCTSLAVMALLLLCVQICWPVIQERAAIRVVEREGGAVVTSIEAPDWARQLVGEEVLFYRRRVTRVNLPVNSYQPGHLARQIANLETFSQLRSVRLLGTAICEADLVHLQNLHKLERLDLESTRVGDGALQILGSIPSLRRLNLYGTQVSDAGLPRLATMKHLQELFLTRSRVTPEGMACLQKELPKTALVIGRRRMPPL